MMISVKTICDLERNVAKSRSELDRLIAEVDRTENRKITISQIAVRLKNIMISLNDAYGTTSQFSIKTVLKLGE